MTAAKFKINFSQLENFKAERECVYYFHSLEKEEFASFEVFTSQEGEILIKESKSHWKLIFILILKEILRKTYLIHPLSL